MSGGHQLLIDFLLIPSTSEEQPLQTDESLGGATNYKGVGDSATSEARALPFLSLQKVNHSLGENNQKPCY